MFEKITKIILAVLMVVVVMIAVVVPYAILQSFIWAYVAVCASDWFFEYSVLDNLSICQFAVVFFIVRVLIQSSIKSMQSTKAEENETDKFKIITKSLSELLTPVIVLFVLWLIKIMFV